MPKWISKTILCLLGIGLVSGCFSSDKWEKIESGKVFIFCKPQDLAFGRTVLSIVNAQLPELLWLFQRPSLDTLVIYIAENQKEFDRLTGNEIPEWGVAAVDLSRNQIYLKSSSFRFSEMELKQIVIHELCHWVMNQTTQQAKMDRWFIEGLAVFVSKEYGLWEKLRIAQSFLFGQTLRLEEIDHVLRFNPEKAALAYAESVSAVEYLIDQYGFEAVQDMVSRMAQGISFHRAFRASIGMDLTEFQQSWMTSIKGKYAKYLMLHFSFLLSLVFVILFFMALWSTRRRTQHIQKNWQKGETDEEEIIPEDASWHRIHDPSTGDALDMDEFSSHGSSIC